MFKDSSSPQSDYNKLLNWLQLAETQEVLEILKQEADSLKTLLTQLTPNRDLGHLLGDLIHREQSLGETRGLSRLQNLIDDRVLELQRKLDLIPKQASEPIQLDGYPTD